ncbi:hypothetical protein GCK32_014577 [Trichostrongylus colubriformis]|uniref:Secreted protein n=1 Tax=Trichostrongylus colubriformis TaxID=6319 RepID=A0AAN8IEY4_TRICO
MAFATNSILLKIFLLCSLMGMVHSWSMNMLWNFESCHVSYDICYCNRIAETVHAMCSSIVLQLFFVCRRARSYYKL